MTRPACRGGNNHTRRPAAPHCPAGSPKGAGRAAYKQTENISHTNSSSQTPCCSPQAPGQRATPQRESETEDRGKTSTPRTASVKPGDKVYIIGFNLGPALALTDEGIRAQITSGTVSQDGGSDRIMYTTPTLVGSSGAPVINSRGQLVAVNFATITGTQGFNYGIKVKHLTHLLNDSDE